jgi:hypothetical protein
MCRREHVRSMARQAIEIGRLRAGYSQKRAKGSEHIAENDGDSGEEKSARNISACILDFSRHHRSRFASDEGKNDDGPEEKVLDPVRRYERVGCKGIGRAESDAKRRNREQ